MALTDVMMDMMVAKIAQHRALFEEGGDLISPAKEISAYEAIWLKLQTTKRVADVFRKCRHALPQTVAQELGIGKDAVEAVKMNLEKLIPFQRYSALFFKDFEYPERLRIVRNPVEVLYYQGSLDLLSSKSISIVGARKCSDNGTKRARKLAKALVSRGYTIMSGLAEGIDTAAHESAIESSGRTIGVIGTPLNSNYPPMNEDLQQEIAANHLLVSQVPFCLYASRDYRTNRVFFPERNITMSALSEATVIVEASDTSGSLYQARAAIAQRRKLFILNSCFESGLKWPDYYLSKGAVRIRDTEEILEILQASE